MAIIVGDTAFLHVPKTGGIWIKHMAKVNGLAPELYIPGANSGGWEMQMVEQSTIACHHNAVLPPGRKFRHVIMVEREPVGWYESLWMFRVHPSKAKYSWSRLRPFDRNIDYWTLSSFGQFIDRVQRVYVKQPWLQSLYAAYRKHATHVINFAYLTDGVRWALGDVMLPPAVNRRKFDWHCSEEEAQEIRRYEAWLTERHAGDWCVEYL